MDRYADYQAFVAIVESGGLTAAARRLDRSLQSVSRSLSALERMIGVELLRRTTRRSHPTEAGQRLYRRLNSALSEIETAKLEAAEGRAEPGGLLRITASSAFGPLYVVPAIGAYLARYPRAAVELSLSDSCADLVGEGFDLAIRLGELPNSALKARKLADMRRVVFASPDYLARYGRPRRPEDLGRHDCIVRSADDNPTVWGFLSQGRSKRVKIEGRLKTSSAVASIEAAALGLGIAHGPLWHARPYVDRGALEVILARFERPPMPLHAVWPAAAIVPAKTSAFVALFAERLKRVEL